MAKVLVIYYSQTGNTRKMAEAVTKGVEEEGVEGICQTVEKVEPQELLNYDGIIIGSPTYYGSMAGEIKKFLDKTVAFHGKLEGKVGGAFSSSGVLGGGCETTVCDILKALLIHGMIVQGTSSGAHYGAVAIGSPSNESLKSARNLGNRVAQLVKKLQK